MAETLGKPARKPRQKPLSERQADDAAPESNVVQLPNVPSEDHLAQTLLNGIADLRKFDAKIEAKMAEVKNLRGDRKGIVAKLGAAGLPASLVKEAIEDLQNPRTDTGEKEKARAFIRKTVQLPTADWSAAFDGLPTGAVEEIDWEARGYSAGVLGEDSTPPDNCPPERHQNFLTGWQRVMDARAMKLAPASDAFN